MTKILKAIKQEIKSLIYIILTTYPDTYIGMKLRHIYWTNRLRSSGKNLQFRKGSGIGYPNLIDVGDNFILGNSSLITANSSYGIFVGNNVSIARNVLIHSANHSFDEINIPIMQQKIISPKLEYNNKFYSVIIKDNVWIGSQSVLLPGTVIESGCVISSGSIVSGNFPENSLIMGNPARVIKSRIVNIDDKENN
jgi:maltose O-acetyltransferase|tara:strand:- start:22081 stop:22665 length:585 start_codon:yes stop_codon:yes gene_type:complete